MAKFHLKLLTGLLLFFGLVIAVMCLYEPFMLKIYEWKLSSDDPAARVAAVDWFLAKGKLGREKLREVYPDGPRAAELILECWADDNMKIEKPTRAEALLGQNTNLTEDMYDGWYFSTYLHVAAFKGYYKTAEILLARGASIEEDSSMIVVQPVLAVEDASCVYYGMELEGSPLNWAAAAGDTRMARLLLSHGAAIETGESRNPLKTALYNRHLETAAVLIRKGADCTKTVVSGLPSIHWAVKENHPSLLELMLQFGASVDSTDETDNTPLHQAVCDGRKYLVELLLAKGANVNAANDMGVTPLHMAVSGGHDGILEILISEHARVNVPDEDNATPLHYAAESGRLKAAELLISKNAPVDAKDDRGNTPLLTALRFGHADVARALIKVGASLDVEDRTSRTPLHWAALWGKKDVAAMLLTKKSEPNPLDCRGSTPLDLALRYKHSGVESILRAHGAKTAAELKNGKTDK